MIFAWALSLIALGTGIYLTFYIHMPNHAHVIIGYIVIVGCVLQPLTGWWHHVLYKKGTGNGGGNGKEGGSMKRSYMVTHMHVWWGRMLITLGIINGGLGLQLSRQVHAIDAQITAEIVYGVGAGMVWALWMGVSVMGYLRNEHRKGEKALDMQIGSGTETPQSEEEKHVQTSVVF